MILFSNQKKDFYTEIVLVKLKILYLLFKALFVIDKVQYMIIH